MQLELEKITVLRRERPVLHQVSLTLNPGEVVGLIGPNGAGKTTLMEAALGLIPFQGRSNLAALEAQLRARQAAYLPQTREIAWPVSVEDLIALGRLPWPGVRGNAKDRSAIEAAISRMHLQPFRKRTALRLSGGEQTRCLIARALAQETPLLLADEPVAGLDPAQQLACLRLFRDLAQEGHGLLVSIHDLGLAARFCDRLVLLVEGRALAEGSADEVLRNDVLEQAFGIRAMRFDADGIRVIVPV